MTTRVSTKAQVTFQGRSIRCGLFLVRFATVRTVLIALIREFFPRLRTPFPLG